MTRLEQIQALELLKDALRGSHIAVDSLWYNPISRRVWVNATDTDLAKVITKAAHSDASMARVTAWRVVRGRLDVKGVVESIAKDILSHAESGVVRG